MGISVFQERSGRVSVEINHFGEYQIAIATKLHKNKTIEGCGTS